VPPAGQLRLRILTRCFKADRLTTEIQSPNPLWFAAWRWHFFAGLCVVPFLADIHHGDYPVYAKMIAWEIAFPESDLGAWNLAFNTLFCFSVIAMSVSGIGMWIKHRPTGARTGAPSRPASIARDKGALLIPLALSVACLLLGLTLLAVILPDFLILSAIPPLKRLVH
jgi:uncharacterized iron-regulated membrane protein